VIRINEHLVFFLLLATSSTEEENEYHVRKYHKLEIYDFTTDNEISKKALLKYEHSVDIDSIVVNDADTIRFIVNESSEDGDGEIKKYILRWTPFIKDENNKDTKKKEIKGTQAFNILRLYPFNKILGMTLAKKSEGFSLFSRE
jgi:hypothetical protein